MLAPLLTWRRVRAWQAIEIVQKQDTFVFTVEATGALPPADIVQTGAPTFTNKQNPLSSGG